MRGEKYCLLLPSYFSLLAQQAPCRASRQGSTDFTPVFCVPGAGVRPDPRKVSSAEKLSGQSGSENVDRAGTPREEPAGFGHGALEPVERGGAVAAGVQFQAFVFKPDLVARLPGRGSAAKMPAVQDASASLGKLRESEREGMLT